MIENKALTTDATTKHAAWEAAVLPLNYSRSNVIYYSYMTDSKGFPVRFDWDEDRPHGHFTTP